MLAKFLSTQNHEKSMLYNRFNHGHTKSTFLEMVTGNPYFDGNVFTIKLWLKTTKSMTFVCLIICTCTIVTLVTTLKNHVCTSFRASGNTSTQGPPPRRWPPPEILDKFAQVMSGPKLWDKCAVYDLFFVYNVPESLGYTSGSFMPSSVICCSHGFEKRHQKGFHHDPQIYQREALFTARCVVHGASRRAVVISAWNKRFHPEQHKVPARAPLTPYTEAREEVKTKKPRFRKCEKHHVLESVVFSWFVHMGLHVTHVEAREEVKTKKPRFRKCGFFVVCPYGPLCHPCGGKGGGKNENTTF